VVLQVSLKVEVGKLILLADVKELGKLGIRVDDATILLILKVVGLNVGVDLLAYISSCHLGSNRLVKELSELVTNASRLYEARRSAVGVVASLLVTCLLSQLNLAVDSLLKGLVIILDGGKQASNLLKLSAKLRHLLKDNGDLADSVSSLELISGLRGRRRCGLNGDSLLDSLLYTRLGSGCGCGLFRRLCSSNHTDYILL
tara:strand:- start:7423 stop:8025 length:603 start_codon:yes stop_codon:yes gene_type:complete